MSAARDLQINIDGAARGNPGPAAFAYVITREGAPPVEAAGCIGIATNNVAEYTALVRALERARDLGGKRLLIRSDSELLVKQMNGVYKVKNDSLKKLYDRAVELCASFADVAISHVWREQNRRADQLCNDALDGRMTGAGPALPQTGTGTQGRPDGLRDKVAAILKEAAASWAEGNPDNPDPISVAERICGVLKESDLRE